MASPTQQRMIHMQYTRNSIAAALLPSDAPEEETQSA